MINNLVKDPCWSFFVVKILSGFKPLTNFAKKGSIADV